MDFESYQERAGATDQCDGDTPAARERELLVRFLGLAGESGSAASAYKKHVRDGTAYEGWRSQMREELGDVLWYISSIASRLNLKLADIAHASLDKTTGRWLPGDNDQLDGDAPAEQQLPRQGVMEFRQSIEDGRPTVQIYMDGQKVGDPLTDNSRNSDGYRFHDAFHLGYAVILGWSPVLRSLLRRKRKYDRHIDEAEDGGRAIVTEEGVSAYAFAYASLHSGLEGINRIDNTFLDSIVMMTRQLEVGVRSTGDWELAIMEGHRIFRHLHDNGGGTITFDADEQSMIYSPPEKVEV
ncbi:hypothetical protein BKG80_05850 [Mycobacteroides chelonae]|nr:hypothetical protein BKG80_05850 [Mycobacteroides chelonae]